MSSTSEQQKSIQLDVLFNRMPELHATDLHLKVGNPPMYRVDGDLHRTKSEPLTDGIILKLVRKCSRVTRRPDSTSAAA